jgi:hypothetical protein
MSAPRTWPGISNGEWLINSNTPTATQHDPAAPGAFGLLTHHPSFGSDGSNCGTSPFILVRPGQLDQQAVVEPLVLRLTADFQRSPSRTV